MAPMRPETTRCCIVGAGPAGVLLGLLLSRRGVPVTVLESQKDLDRDFRGDALFPWVMETLEELGLCDKLLRIPHARARGYTFNENGGAHQMTDYSRLKTRFNFVLVVPQNRLLEFLVEEAAGTNFRLLLGAAARELVQEDGVVRGVRYEDAEGLHELRATLTIGADGRASKLRTLAGFELKRSWPSGIDVLWFRLPRFENDRLGVNQQTRFGRGYYVSFVDRQDQWQVSYSIPKGAYPRIRAAGLDDFRKSVSDLEPLFADRMKRVEWPDVRFLPVDTGRVRRWHRPGLLLIGDAAHVMSPIGGVGITSAMQDAVETFNVLAEPLLSGDLCESHLARVQRRREIPTIAMQFLQRLVERQYVTRAFHPDRPFRTPWLLKLPGMNYLSAAVTAYGVWPVRISRALCAGAVRELAAESAR